MTLAKLPGYCLGRELLDAAKSPRAQFAQWADLRRTRAATAFLRTAAPPANGRIALLISLSGWIFQLKIEAMLATGLRLAGWRIIVLTDRRTNHVARRYFKAYGLDELIYWNEVAAPDSSATDLSEAVEMLTRDMSFRAVKAWTFRGCWIGPQVIATASRFFKQASPDLSSAEVRQWIRGKLPRVLRTVLQSEQLLDRLQPQLVFLNEANYSLNGAIVDCAIQRGVTVAQMIQPAKDDALYFWRLNARTRRSHPGSISEESFARIRRLSWTPRREAELDQEFADRYGGRWYLQARNQQDVAEKTRAELVAELNLDPAKKIAVVFSHVLWDANLFYGEDLFADYGDWFVQTIKAAAANPSVNWLVKLHPANVWKRAIDGTQGELGENALIRERIGELPRHVVLLPPEVKISTLSLFKLADYGVTVRGTVGLELPCFSVPVFTAGTGRYSGLGFTNDSASREEYLAKLGSLQEFGRLDADATLLARKHAWAVFRLRAWTMKSFRAAFARDGAGIGSVDHDLQPAARSLAEVEANGDLAQWARWCEPSDTPDFIDWDKAPD